jgi:DNA-binding beta-propeller fold protein YncE
MLRNLLIILVIAAIVVFGVMQLRGPLSSDFATLGEFSVDGNAEIIQAAAGGTHLVHTNSERNSIDVVDITDPGNPNRVASLPMPGEPTSVGASPDGNWAIAVVYASASRPGKKPVDGRLPGVLALLDLREPAEARVVTTLGIGHHPDSIAVTTSGDELLAIIAIENEPVIIADGKVIDDDAPGQLNDISFAGLIEIVALNPNAPRSYRVTRVELPPELLRNSLMLFEDDPQPEYVTISPGKHLAAISLQENNGIVLLDPAKGEIVGSFSLGSVTNRLADLKNDDAVSLTQNYPAEAGMEPLAGTRFPDGISFSPDGQYLLSADEGEMKLTGGRGFSIWSLDGQFIWDDGGEIERLAAEQELYPDHGSDVRGVEICGITAARFGDHDYAFALSERGSFVAIYDISNPLAPVFVQILPVGSDPESAIAIPERDLLVVASEDAGTLTIIGHTARAN